MTSWTEQDIAKLKIKGRGTMRALGRQPERDQRPTAATLVQPLAPTAPLVSKRSKYGARHHIVYATGLIVPADEAPVEGGRRFDSKREADRYWALRMDLEQGRISHLELQKQFALHVVGPDGVKVQIGSYRCDFAYVRGGDLVIEDSKGFRGVEAYKIRKRHVEAEYGIRVIEV
jgi:hypothetical protein